MFDVIEALKGLIGTVPVGFEWFYYLLLMFMFMLIFQFFSFFIAYLLKWVGGVK